MGTGIQTVMIHLGTLAIFTLLGMATGMPPSDCCREKTVGYKTYQLVGLEDTSQYDCLQHCVYETLSSAGLFCFAAGDLEVVCADEPMGETGGGSGAGNEGAGGPIDSPSAVEASINAVNSQVSELTNLLESTAVDSSSPAYNSLTTIKSSMEDLSSALSSYLSLLQNRKQKAKRQADCAKVQDYFGAIQAAEASIKSAQSAVETIAQRWTSQCMFDHDKVRNLCDGTTVGQNAWQSGSDYEYYDTDVNPNIGDAVNAWYNEVTNPGFDASNINPYVFGHGYGHYTAVVWAETDRVGCGRVYYEGTGGWFYHLVICNYAVSGNLVGGTMYEVGDKCSNCPAGYSCDATYDGLCTKN